MEKTKLTKIKRIMKKEDILHWVVGPKMYQTWKGIINHTCSSKYLPHGEEIIIELNEQEFNELRELELITGE